MFEARRIFIRPEPFGCGFDVTVEPAPEWINMARERPTHREAQRYALGLRAVHGWRIVDETGEAA